MVTEQILDLSALVSLVLGSFQGEYSLKAADIDQNNEMDIMVSDVVRSSPYATSLVCSLARFLPGSFGTRM